MTGLPRTNPDLAPARAAAAEVVRIHQRRHPADSGCCCSWRPRAAEPGWAHHVAEQLEHAGVLTTPPTVPAATAGDPSA